MEVIIVKDADEVAVTAADICCDMLTIRPNATLGLATGSTPIRLYEQLVSRYRAGDISFAKVATFNLDEYLGVGSDSPLSYRRFMNEHLFDHTDIDFVNTHFPTCAPGSDPRLMGPEYEDKIQRRGGIDLQVLGIGANGHIGFNEPGSSLGSCTRIKTLAQRTVNDNNRLLSENQIQPDMALTMGIGTILNARRILMLATGESKARAIARAVEGAVTAMCPASALQMHAYVRIVVDEAAAKELMQTEYYRWVRKKNESITAEHGGRAGEDPWFHPSLRI